MCPYCYNIKSESLYLKMLSLIKSYLKHLFLCTALIMAQRVMKITDKLVSFHFHLALPSRLKFHAVILICTSTG